jgi:hypothetical protein
MNEHVTHVSAKSAFIAMTMPFIHSGGWTCSVASTATLMQSLRISFIPIHGMSNQVWGITHTPASTEPDCGVWCQL